MTKKYLNLIQDELNKNEDCKNSNAYYIDNGYMYSKDKEVIALLSDNNYGKYFYAHIFRNDINHKWISLIAWVPKLIVNYSIDDIFKQYAKTVIEGDFAPCRIEENWQAYAESKTFGNACHKLVNIINAYKLEKRLYDDQNEIYTDYKYEMRIFNVY
jgi:hypothetical protein